MKSYRGEKHPEIDRERANNGEGQKKRKIAIIEAYCLQNDHLPLLHEINRKITIGIHVIRKYNVYEIDEYCNQCVTII